MNHDEGKTFAGNFVINLKSVGGAVGHRYWVLNARDGNWCKNSYLERQSLVKK
jgi:hypothetical protein